MKTVVLLTLFLLLVGCVDSRYDRNNIGLHTKALYPRNGAELRIDFTTETRCDLNTLFGINRAWLLLSNSQKILKKVTIVGSTMVIQRGFPPGEHVLLLKTRDEEGRELVFSLTLINGKKETDIRAQYEQDERKRW